MPFHILEDRDGEFIPKLSFESEEEAAEFITFLKGNFFVVSVDELEEYVDTVY